MDNKDSETTGIVYALVARQTNVLAEYTTPGLRGNFPSVTRLLLSKIDTVADSLTYLCMAGSSFGRITPFNFLESIRARFVSSYGSKGINAIAYSFNSEFSNVIKKQIETFNNGSSGNRSDDKISLVQKEIDTVRTVMVENIDKVLERGEKIELLVDKSDSLSADSYKFKKSSRTLKNTMWWNKIKVYIAAFIILVVIIYLILAMACGGFGLKKC